MAKSFLRPAAIALNGNKLTDHNRSPVNVSGEDIEKRVRLASGKLRKYHVATKKSFSMSWEDAPHRAERCIDGYWGGRDIAEFLDTARGGEFTLTVYHFDGTTDTYTVVLNDFNYDVLKRYANGEKWDFNLELEEV